MLDLKQIEAFYPDYLKSFKRNILREYLQYKTLEAIFNSHYGNELRFMGGTASRIIHGNTRFSEDLDFDNVDMQREDFQQLIEHITKILKFNGCNVDVKIVFKEVFHAYLTIHDILFESGLSAHKAENIIILVDTQPQGFQYTPQKHLLNRFDVLLYINVVPIDILLAQKICAIFTRRRPMGRDFYDMIFLSGKTKANMEYLAYTINIKGNADLKDKLLKKCKDLDFKQLAKDVEQFLFVPSDSKKILLFNDYLHAMDF